MHYPTTYYNFVFANVRYDFFMRPNGKIFVLFQYPNGTGYAGDYRLDRFDEKYVLYIEADFLPDEVANYIGKFFKLKSFI